MLDVNTKQTCSDAGLLTPCYHPSYSGDQCVVIGSGSIMVDISAEICSTTNPTECPQLLDVFVHMGNKWQEGSTCGATSSGGYCSQGKDYSNLWSLCAREN